MATQNLNLALQPIILDIDDTTSQIATLLAAQTNDQERYALAEKIIIELLNKNKEQRDLFESNEKLLKEQKDLLETKDNERKDLLENNDKLLHEQEDLLHEREKLLAMSAQQLGKIQALESDFKRWKDTLELSSNKRLHSSKYRIQRRTVNTLSASRLQRSTRIYKTSNTTTEDCSKAKNEQT